MKTKFALAFYYISIATLVLSALGIVWRFIIFPPCTQIGNNCVLQPWDISGFAGTVLGVSATMVGILGALAVAAWWTSLKEQVTKQVTTLYNGQKQEIDDLLKNQKQQLETNIQESQIGVRQLEQLMRDTEEIIVDSFVSMGDLFSEKVARKAIEKDRFWRFPYAMVKGYTEQLEHSLQKAHEEINSSKNQLDTAFNSQQEPDFKLGMFDYFLCDQPTFSDKTNILQLYGILDQLEAGNYWLSIAKNNEEKTTFFTQDERKLIQEHFEQQKPQIEKLQEDIKKAKTDFTSKRLDIENELSPAEKETYNERHQQS